MPARVNAKERDPVRYAKVQAEQKALEEQYSTYITIARLCPHCDFKVEVLYQGSHGAMQTRCRQCGELVFFPPVVFRFGQ